MSDEAISAFIHEEHGIVEIEPRHIRALIEKELADPRMRTAMELARKKNAAASTLPTVADIEARVLEQMDGLESLLRDVHYEYVMGKGTRGEELREVLRECGADLSERDIKRVLAVARKLSLDRAISNAASVSRELRGTVETWLKMRGIIQTAPTVNILSVQEATADMLSKLCPSCQARVAGLPTIDTEATSKGEGAGTEGTPR